MNYGGGLASGFCVSDGTGRSCCEMHPTPDNCQGDEMYAMGISQGNEAYNPGLMHSFRDNVLK